MKKYLILIIVVTSTIFTNTNSLKCDSYSDSLQTVINELTLKKLELLDSISTLNNKVDELTILNDSINSLNLELINDNGKMFNDIISLNTQLYDLKQVNEGLVNDLIEVRQENYELDSINYYLKNSITLTKIELMNSKLTIDSLKTLNSQLSKDNKSLLKIIEVQEEQYGITFEENYNLKLTIDSLINNPALVVLIKETISSVGQEYKYNQKSIIPISLSNNYLEIQLPKETNNDVWIYDLSGKVFYNRKNFNDNVYYNCSELNSGLYFVTVNRNGDQVVTYKFLKE